MDRDSARKHADSENISTVLVDLMGYGLRREGSFDDIRMMLLALIDARIEAKSCPCPEAKPATGPTAREVHEAWRGYCTASREWRNKCAAGMPLCCMPPHPQEPSFPELET